MRKRRVSLANENEPFRIWQRYAVVNGRCRRAPTVGVPTCDRPETGAPPNGRPVIFTTEKEEKDSLVDLCWLTPFRRSNGLTERADVSVDQL